MCNCMFCGHKTKSQILNQFIIFNCPVCGCYTINNFEITEKFMPYFNLPEEKKIRSEFVTKYASFLFYHKKTLNDYCNKNRFFIGTIESAHLLSTVLGENIEYQLITDDVVNDFYPKTVKKTEKLILSKIYKDRDKADNTVKYTEPEAESLFFIIRDYITPKLIASCTDAYNQINEQLEKLKKKGYIEYSEKILPSSDDISLKLTIDGREFVESLEKVDEMALVNNGNCANNSNLNNSILGNNNTQVNFNISQQSIDYSPQQKHDIVCLERILGSIPKNFEQHLERRLLANRQYKQTELDYIFNLFDIINDNDNFLVDEELRQKIEQLRDASVKLSNLINRQFCCGRNNTDLMLLDRPLPGESSYRQIYEKYLQEELPQALIAFKKAYDEVCHTRTIKLGI